jgi:acetyl-CoA carboxylase biotin carboxyl carrier protein
VTSISTALTHADVRKIVGLVEALHRSRLQSLRLEADALQIDIGRNGVTTAGATASPFSTRELAAIEGVVVPSPHVGVFRPGSDAPVQTGSVVEPASVLGSIETLDDVNPVKAGLAGTLAEQLVRDGDFVEYGQPLYRILPTAA